jgi:hypothetical protein
MGPQSDVKLGMTFYLGYPLRWPDSEIFGTICVLDRKDNPRATQFRELISEFQQFVERDLGLVIAARERQELLEELQRHRDKLQEMVAEQTSELQREKEELEEQLRFEDLISDLSASFVGLSGCGPRRDCCRPRKDPCFLQEEHSDFWKFFRTAGPSNREHMP